jgi:hypothetical protein
MQSNKSLHSNRFRTAACEASSYETEVDLNREGSRLQLANQSIGYFHPFIIRGWAVIKNNAAQPVAALHIDSDE